MQSEKSMFGLKIQEEIEYLQNQRIIELQKDLG